MVLASTVGTPPGLAPFVSWLGRRLGRLLSIVVAYTLLAAVMLALGLLVLSPFLNQTGTVIAAAPEQLDRAQHWLDRLSNAPVPIDQAVTALGTSIGRAGGALLSLPLRLASAATELLIIVVMSVYLLLAAPGLRAFLLFLAGPEQRKPTDALLKDVTATMGGYVRGMAVDVFAVGALIYVGLLLLGVHYALALAVLAGIGAIVPIVGPILTAIPALAVALSDSPAKALFVLVLFVAVHQLEGAVLLPNLMDRQAAIPPLLVLFAVAAGAATGSVLGILLAIPLAGAARILVVRVAAPTVRRWTGAEP
jgi:predicted PurR-regulated permease PerM